MTLDTDKIDDAALAILSLTLHDGDRVWKGIDWDITDRLFEKGLIHDPKNKAKSLSLTPEGVAHAREILAREFSKAEGQAALRDFAVVRAKLKEAHLAA